MADPKEVIKEEAAVPIVVGAVGDAGKTGGGDDQQPTSMVGGTAEDTPDDDASLDARVSAAVAAADGNFTGDKQSNADITNVNVDVVKGGGPVAKKQKIVEASPCRVQVQGGQYVRNRRSAVQG